MEYPKHVLYMNFKYIKCWHHTERDTIMYDTRYHDSIRSASSY